MARHSEKRDRRKILHLKDYQPEEPRAEIEYGEPEEEEASQEGGEKKKAWQAPKAFYRVAVILLAAVLVLALWVNRASLTPENIANWVRTQVMGAGEGDGYPVSITGSTVSEGNFLATDGNAVLLSDTAFTVLSPSGRELLSLRHSFNQPILKSSYSQYLLYNQGGPGYTLVAGTEIVRENQTAAGDILAGAICPSGRYALATRSEEGASQLTVYLATGEEQFTYSFARDYITAVALNYDGTCGAVCTVRSQGGELISRVTVFDFNRPEPVTEYETQDNLLLGISWGENGAIYAVGDGALLRARSSDYAFSEYRYDGRRPTAFCLAGGQAYLSVSAYEHAGACTLLVFQSQGDPVEYHSQERVVSLSSYGSTVGVLEGHRLVLVDAATGEELARTDAGSDAKSVALTSESSACVLGASEVRQLDLQG